MSDPQQYRRRALLLISAMLLTAWAACFAFRVQPYEQTTTRVEPHLENPDAICATCHRAIYERYEQTAMARGSGVASSALLPGSFHHDASDIDYRVFARGGVAWMSFARPGESAKGALAGEQELAFFIGSGNRGRTYLYRQGNQWFELPINYYTARQRWAMTPAYEDVSRLPAALPIDPNCLHCHTSMTEASLPTARNAYAGLPFRQGGVGCGGCHGDPTSHLALQGRGPIVSPSKLNPARRDSVCIQCHLEGDAVVYRAGRSLSRFKPGDDLNDFAVYFVHQSRASGGARAVSQYEALLHSACKRGVGDAFTCTTCHDPHGDPPAAQRTAYFRSRCLMCHTSPAMVTHHPEQPDCAACHMPARNTTDISHVQVTDHDIERVPITRTPSSGEPDVLVPVGRFVAGDREFGLAYAQTAMHGFPGASEQARRRLESALREGAHDADFEIRLAYFEQLSGNPEKARALYRAALEQDEWNPAALTNLAVLDATSHQVPEAVHLLENLLAADPSQTVPGLNLAWIQCLAGHRTEARMILQRLQPFNPDDPQLREFLARGNYAGGHCTLVEQGEASARKP